MPTSTQRLHAEAIFAAAIDAVKPAPLVEQALREPEIAAALEKARRVVVVGGGKAGAGMVEGVETALAGRLATVSGHVNVPDSHWAATQAVSLNRARPIGVNEPTVDAANGVDQMLAAIASATSDDVILVLLSGGGSALMPSPVERISLEEKLRVTRLLSSAGASINELNCVRKHLSRIKGGRLAQMARRANSIWSLIISDVVGNPLDVIASGPTAPDPTTYSDALTIIGKLELVNQFPPTVMRELELGSVGWIPETPKSLPGNVHNRIIASNDVALFAAKRKARALGYDVTCLGNDLVTDTLELAKVVATYVPVVPGHRPLCILLGGETSVHLGKHPGKGGRNQEFVLALGIELKRNPNRITILSGGTDGEDGPTDAAGAVWNDDVVSMCMNQALAPGDFLRDHNSYWFFRATGGLVETGLTGTNVMDIRLVLIDGATSRE